ncbi:MAG: hypothetical protein MR051_09130 [Lentisphaeria bacterium]|nr:hypothetical protein [Lentisphaeria bacterium]
MNKRKYPFRRGRGRNWLPYAQALLTVLAVTAALVWLFEYRHEAPVKKEQNAVLSRIVPGEHREFIRQLDLRDPARVFGVSGGGFAALRPGRTLRREFAALLPPESPSPTVPGAFRKLTEYAFPVSPRQPVPLAAKRRAPLPGRTVIAPSGEIIRLEIPAGRSAAVRGDTVLMISGSGTLRRYRVVNSGGDAAADRRAGRALLDAGVADGLYTVVWGGIGEERK